MSLRSCTKSSKGNNLKHINTAEKQREWSLLSIPRKLNPQLEAGKDEKQPDWTHWKVEELGAPDTFEGRSGGENGAKKKEIKKQFGTSNSLPYPKQAPCEPGQFKIFMKAKQTCLDFCGLEDTRHSWDKKRHSENGIKFTNIKIPSFLNTSSQAYSSSWRPRLERYFG